MELNDISELREGSKVYWEDPDEQLCSGDKMIIDIFTPTKIITDGDTLVGIGDEEGGYTTALAKELQ